AGVETAALVPADRAQVERAGVQVALQTQHWSELRLVAAAVEIMTPGRLEHAQLIAVDAKAVAVKKGEPGNLRRTAPGIQQIEAALCRFALPGLPAAHAEPPAWREVPVVLQEHGQRAAFLMVATRGGTSGKQGEAGGTRQRGEPGEVGIRRNQQGVRGVEARGLHMHAEQPFVWPRRQRAQAQIMAELAIVFALARVEQTRRRIVAIAVLGEVVGEQRAQ